MTALLDTPQWVWWVLTGTTLLFLLTGGIAIRRAGNTTSGSSGGRRWYHRAPLFVAIAVAMFLAADGMYYALTERVGRPQWEALLVAVVAELLIIATGIRAERSIHRRGHTAGNAATVFGIAVAAGLVAASSTDNVTAFLVRFLAPVAVAVAWWGDAAELITRYRETRGEPLTRVTWLVSPRRLAVRWGILAPGTENLAAITRDRNIRALSRAIHRYTTLTQGAHRAGRGLRTLERRIHRLAETADDATVAQVRAQLERTRDALALAGITARRPALPAPAPMEAPAAGPAGGSGAAVTVARVPRPAPAPVADATPPRVASAGPARGARAKASPEEAYTTYRDLRDKGGREPTSDRLAAETGLSAGYVRQVRQSWRGRYAGELNNGTDNGTDTKTDAPVVDDRDQFASPGETVTGPVGVTVNGNPFAFTGDRS